MYFRDICERKSALEKEGKEENALEKEGKREQLSNISLLRRFRNHNKKQLFWKNLVENSSNSQNNHTFAPAFIRKGARVAEEARLESV